MMKDDKLGMKRGESGMLKKIFLFTAVCSLLVFGCNDFLEKTVTVDSGTGLVRISIDGSERTLLPSRLENFGALYYVLTFSRDNEAVILKHWTGKLLSNWRCQ